MNLLLTADEITHLTGRARNTPQIDALRRMGMPLWFGSMRPVTLW